MIVIVNRTKRADSHCQIFGDCASVSVLALSECLALGPRSTQHLMRVFKVLV